MTSRVLCLSDDEAFASRISAPLEYSYPEVSVLTVGNVAEGVEVLGSERIDAVVTDARTIAAAPALLDAVRERRPELSLLVLSTYGSGDDRRTAVAEVVDFLDGVGADDDGALAGWVANSVVEGARSGSPPGASRIESVVGAIKRELVDATRPGDVEAAVCEQLVLADRYAFAWIGEYDRGEEQVVPWGTASSSGDWPRSRTFPAGEDVDGVVARVLRDRSAVIVDDVDGSGEVVPWRDEALDRDCRALAFVPLQTDDGLFGVLGVYSTDPEGFGVEEREALVEIANTTARVLEGMAIRGRIDQQERTLRRYERLVETVGDGMYALDADGHFMTVNDALCAMTGYAREGLLGEHIEVILGEDGVDAWLEAVGTLTGTAGESRSIELEIVTKTGETVPCENKVGLLPSDEDGEPRGTVGVLRDITERKERERELQRQNERLDAFASIVSHDLRNPLGVARGYLEVVAESTNDGESVERIAEALDRMNQLVDDVLALARGGEAVTETASIYFPSLVDAAWSNVETGEATLEVDADVTIRADESRLLRLFENLFRNSVEHGSTGPRSDESREDAVEHSSTSPGSEDRQDAIERRGEDVAVTVGLVEGTAPNRIGFFVEDDGPGMPPEVREHVFESRFTTSEHGHGIGLYVVSEVADAHGWTATATVGSEGGARFEFANVELGE